MNEVNELSLGLSFNYVPNWGNWEVVRELTSNARDTGAEFHVFKEENNLVIRDFGEGLAIKHLLIGESGSRQDGEKIGQFGEGLKNAILVLTRNGKHVEILATDKRIVNATKEIEGVKTLSFLWEKIEIPIQGTKIIIHDWNEEENYQDKFLFTQEDVKENIILTNTSGSILWETSLYNQGVFIQELKDYRFGYNINNKEKNNRDRNIISEWEMQGSIGEIWQLVDDSEGWKEFFLSSHEGKLENNIRLNSWSISQMVKDAIQKGFKLAFGEKAVLKTSEEAGREAEHRGAKAIEQRIFGYYLKGTLSELIQTDHQFVMEKEGIKAYNVPLSHLNPIQKKNLSIIKKMAKKLEFYGQIFVAELPECPGLYDPNENIIKIRPDKLLSESDARECAIHELAHALYGTQDVTDDHVNACCKIGTRLLMLQ